jgi:hypothetical protein
MQNIGLPDPIIYREVVQSGVYLDHAFAHRAEIAHELDCCGLS